MQTAEQTRFKITDRVVDRDGFQGTIVKVTEWEGSTWFDVRSSSGVAVRFASELAHVR